MNFIVRNKKVFVFSSVMFLFLVGVSLTQLIIENLSSSASTPVAFVEQQVDKDIEVVSTTETIQSPVGDTVELVGKFYDNTLPDDELENALVYFEGVYRPSVGVSYSNENEAFDVYASLTGIVTKKTNDPLLGWVITITSDQGITTTYQSLGEVYVEKEDEIRIGELIGVSGENVYEADLKNHLHFIIEVNDVPMNPEKMIGKTLSEVA